VFVDTSVFVAILSQEVDADDWSKRLEAADGLVTTALVVLEAVMRLSSKLDVEPEEAENIVRRMLGDAAIRITPIDEPEARTAIQAFSDFGKGRGHPAQLNIADCLSYACAKNLKVPLLYKGGDFARTDMA